MNIKRKIRAAFGLLMMMVAAMGLLMLFAMQAEAQVAPLIVPLTNFPPTLAGAAGTNVNSYIPIYARRGLALHQKLNAVSGVANSILAMSFSVDGTNAGTTLFTWTNAVTSTTDKYVVTNFTAAQLAGYSALVINFWTNEAATAGVIITNKQLFYRIEP